MAQEPQNEANDRAKFLDDIYDFHKVYGTEIMMSIISDDGMVSSFASPMLQHLSLEIQNDFLFRSQIEGQYKDSSSGILFLIQWFLIGFFITAFLGLIYTSEMNYIPILLSFVPLSLIVFIWYVLRKTLVKKVDENLVELMESDTSHDTETAIQNLIDRAQALKHHTRSEIILALVGSKSHVVTYGSTPGLRALLRKYKVKKVVEKNREKRLLEAQGITDDYLAENAALYFAWAFSTGFLVLLVLWSFLSSATKSMIMPSAAMLGIFAVISLVYYSHMRAANKKD